MELHGPVDTHCPVVHGEDGRFVAGYDGDADTARFRDHERTHIQVMRSNRRNYQNLGVRGTDRAAYAQ